MYAARHDYVVLRRTSLRCNVGSALHTLLARSESIHCPAVTTLGEFGHIIRRSGAGCSQITCTAENSAPKVVTAGVLSFDERRPSASAFENVRLALRQCKLQQCWRVDDTMLTARRKGLAKPSNPRLRHTRDRKVGCDSSVLVTAVISHGCNLRTATSDRETMTRLGEFQDPRSHVRLRSDCCEVVLSKQ